MKAIVCRGDGTAAVDMAEVDEPRPDERGLVVEVVAASINRGELGRLAGQPPGWRPGQDIAGIVVRSASNGEGPAEGTRVVGWVDQAGWAERVAVPIDRIATLADEVAFEEAATLPVAGVTALRALRQGGSLLGRKILVTGAAGGVGRFAVELGALGGAEVTAVVGEPKRSAGMTQLGASEVLFDLSDAGSVFDLILESVGGESLGHAVNLVSVGGTLVVIGNSSRLPTLFDFRLLPKRPFRLSTFFVYESGRPFGPDMQTLADLVATGRCIHMLGCRCPGPTPRSLSRTWRSAVSMERQS